MVKPLIKKRSKGQSNAKEQFAALPWRVHPHRGLEILVITSRQTHRTVIPKGWPIKGLAPNMAAMQEAYEEAGVEGYISMAPLGAYSYVKHLPKNRHQSIRVEVYSLQVSTEHLGFPEVHERTKLWVTPAEAAELVEEPELKLLITGFDPMKIPPPHQAVSKLNG